MGSAYEGKGWILILSPQSLILSFVLSLFDTKIKIQPFFVNVTKTWCLLSQLLNGLIHTFDQWGLHYNGLQNYAGLRQ